ncbi:MAG TPA: carboxypeptidase regulatory-like domain-containing protein [Terriglobia bacterium]|nr:carboxypeptidase regulatory-like domain-containing protein [Terriglobia bacterium]
MREFLQPILIQRDQRVHSKLHLSSCLQIRLPENWNRGLSARRAALATALLFTLILSPAFATAQVQTGTVRGTTTAPNPQGQPIPLGGVAVKLTANAPGLPPQTAYSNEQGEFELNNIPAGSYTLEASVQGFTPVTRKITITAGQTLTENVQMQLQELKQNIEVRESAPIVSTQGTSPAAQTLQTKQLLTIPVVRQEFKQELPVTPGVLQVQSGKLFIKGVPESQSMLLLDSTQAVDPVTGTYSIDVPIDAIQSLDVFKAPFGAQYGGFVGGMTDIELKPPPNQWHLSMHDLNPSIRGKQGHLVGFAKATPRIGFGGPVWKNKINFAESFLYEMRKPDVRGLPWPNDSQKIQGYNSISQFQFLLSPRHFANLTVNLFPRRYQWADLNVLIPRPATADTGQRGYSIDGSDTYQFNSENILHTVLKVLRMETYAHGHGPEDMLLTPTGIGGNYFNTWGRNSHQEEGLAVLNLATKQWAGSHEMVLGSDVIHRDFTGTSQSHPVQILRNDGSSAERIDFSGPGNLNTSDTSVATFAQDHWIFNNRLAATLGLRYYGETNGAPVNFAPRLGVVYALDQSARTVFQGGVGMFYDRTPMLSGDFNDNPTRIVTPLDFAGFPQGPSVAFRNECARISSGSPETLPDCSDLGSTPRNLTWRLQLTRRFTNKLTAKVGTLYSHTTRLFVIDPITQPDGAGVMLLSNSGSSRYHEYEFTVDYQAGEGAELSMSYVRSESRGNLNTPDNLFVPLEVPVIRPDVYANQPSDVPNRLTGFGIFKLPWKMTFAPSVDLHSGFPYSNVDVLQNYVEEPNGQRYPIYFSLNWRLYKDFPLPFHIHRGHTFRFGIYSVNTTSRHNPTAVYNNITSPMFAQFTGFDKRINGIVIEFTQ